MNDGMPIKGIWSSTMSLVTGLKQWSNANSQVLQHKFCSG